ncbi:ShlB/FhaC/HecB family hemolysin secretion/activation protein [Bradyrhizobium sp.]|uniref:ShlB/FhaC/HecB family hemolysin secretion/activation protein n=1 Tax=Bradyrhizobium sp. TaxID=376 RepID=UPI001DC8BDE2|nr:ShlB/FhaC/HecB family hemolysin secretion/activation protein [Bradyrhizobium sp.]MBI5318797.1 ShlB/FhaC/HecB family hemolysin secretion/activation protein [Bradyrhizobium sp.]
MGLRINEDRAASSPWNYGAAFAFVLGLFALSVSAHAQQGGSPGFDVRQTERRFEAQESEQGSDGRRGVAVPRVARSEAAADPTPLFVLLNISLTGANAIAPAQLAGAWHPFIGKKVSQADLAKIATGIGDIYRAAGFHLSRAIVPPQDIAGGSVRIQVIEGAITDVELKGDGAGQFGIRALLHPVLAEHPSRFVTLERQLMMVNARPGVRITDTQLEEIGTASGHFRLVLSVKTWHVYAFLGVDNLGSSAVGPWQSYATAAYNSLIAPGDTLALNLSTTPGDPRQLRFARLSYDTPVGIDGLRIGASGLYSEVWPGDWRRLFSDNTKTEAFELRASIIPLQSQKQTLTLTLAAGFSNVSERDFFGPWYYDAIRTVSLNADYRLQDSFGGTNYLTVNWRQGLDVLGASDKSDAWTSVWGASPKFSALNFWFTRYQTINDSFSVKLASAGQVASGPMYLSQQFYLGGLAFGRGYGAAEISGDNGIAGSLELRYDRKLNYQYWSGFQLYSFVDSGLVWWDGLRPWDGTALTSAGGGVRLFLVGDLQADLGVAVPLGYRAPDNSTRSARFLFTLSNALKLCPERAATRCL